MTRRDQLVPVMFQRYAGRMDYDLRPVPRHELLFDIERALSKARSLWPRRRVPGDHNALGPVAEAVVEHLALCRIRCFRENPRPGHGTPRRPFETVRREENAGTEGE